MRQDTYSLILNSQPQTFYSKKSGEFINAIVDDINKIREMLFSLLTELFPSLLTLIFTLTYIFYLNWYLSIFVLLLIPIIGLIISFFSKKIKEKTENIQNKVIENYSNIYENFINYNAIKVFALEDKKEKEYFNLETHNNKDSLSIISLISLQPSVIGVVQVTGICIIACFGAYQLFNKALTLAELLSFGTALSLTIEPVIFITKSISIITKSKVSIDNINNMTVFLLNNKDKNVRVINYIDNYQIIFDKVNFYYPDKLEKTLNNINITIQEGQSIAFVGDNGSGKSTIIKLILQFYQGYEGQIRLGKYNINEYNLDVFRQNIKACFHEPFIFTGTIKENILLNNSNYDQLEEVCKITKVDELINNLDNKINYKINHAGNNLSSGQKQRIAIARAIITKPKILILDEATSALDLESEKYIYHEIRKYLPKSTILIVNHRIDSIKFVDQFYWM